MTKNNRSQWTSRAGFILATAGSAIGLGNIWKFPGKVGAGGGGAYIVVYFIIVFTLGLSVMLAEIALGRSTKRNTVGAFAAVDKRWTFVGYMGIISAFLVLSYYSIIGGYVLKYAILYLFGSSAVSNWAETYQSFISNPILPVLYGLIFLAATGLIVLKGVSGGIERTSKFLMPFLFILLITVMIHSIRMPGAIEGVNFIFSFNFSRITPSLLLSALGQALFSLSVGLGTTCTYGSYLKNDENLLTSSLSICILDTLAALLAAFTIIPAVFSTNSELGTGETFIFVALPRVFEKMSGTSFYGFLFFLLLSFAAITSSISMLEGVVSHLTEDCKYSRTKAVTVSCLAIAFFSALYSLSMGAFPLKGIWYTVKDGITFPPFGRMLELITDNILIPLGSLFFCIFAARAWGTKNAIAEITQNGAIPFPLKNAWRITITYLAPVIISVIFISGIIS